MMEDIVLVTADSIRRDYVDSLPYLSSYEMHTGITGAHYTRPSLASLLSSNLQSALESKAISPTLAEVLSEAGYTCLGLAPTPQTDAAFGFGAGFDFYETFREGSGSALKNRRSPVREFFGQFDSVRRLYQWISPMEAIMDSLPSDETVINTAIEQFNAASSPRFLWIHLMRTHRPYGVGEDALAKSLDRKATAAGNDGILRSKTVTEEEVETIKSTYRNALTRMDSQVERLLNEIDSDPMFVFTADHGEEFGEDGYFYHQGFRRRVVDTLTEVPLVIDGIDCNSSTVSLLDIGPTVVESVGIDAPERWSGSNLLTGDGPSNPRITIAPWHDEASVAIRSGDSKLVASHADVSLRRDGHWSEASRTETSDELEQRLQNLGYMDAG